ncbi:MAG: hypothetical protein O8C63_08380 [Candidatus Methanoperedens sp.]|nr:hypothetical protein [Candidatus Methanoperedens sp.]
MQEDIKNNRVTLDSNVLISAVKENEKYSRDCKELLSLVGTSFLLYQPTVTIIELYNGIGRTKGEPSAKKALKDFYNMVYHLEDYGSRSQCDMIKLKDAKYDIWHVSDAIKAIGFHE